MGGVGDAQLHIQATRDMSGTQAWRLLPGVSGTAHPGSKAAVLHPSQAAVVAAEAACQDCMTDGLMSMHRSGPKSRVKIIKQQAVISNSRAFQIRWTW